MSRSKQRSKCTRVGCLLCKPHKARGEPPLAVLRATVDDPRDIALEEDPFEFDYDDDWCPHCDHPFAVGAMVHHVAFMCAVLLYADRYRNLLDRLAMLDGGLWPTTRPTLPEAEMDDARFMRSIERFASEAADVSMDAVNWDDDLRDNVCDTAEWLLLDGVRRMASGSLPPDVFARIGSAWLTIAKTDLRAIGVNAHALLRCKERDDYPYMMCSAATVEGTVNDG